MSQKLEKILDLIKEYVDEKDKPIYGGPNEDALLKSGEVVGYGGIQQQKFRTVEDLNAAADVWIKSQKGFEYTKDRVEEGMSREQAYEAAKQFYLENAAMGIYLQEGGQIPALPEDPPMIDMSSRF